MKHALFATLACLSLAGPTLSATVTYDAAGRMASLTYADGSRVTYSYDKLGNLLAVNRVASAPPTVQVAVGIRGWVGKAITDYQITVDRPAGITGYVVTGLPPGLKANLTTRINADGKTPGTIYGTPASGGDYAIKIAAKSAVGTGLPVTLPAAIANPFAATPDLGALDGAYSVVFAPSAVTGMERGGSAKLTVSKTGSFTGKLVLIGITYAFKGQFDPVTGIATISLPRQLPLSSLQLTLTLGLSDANRADIHGSITDGSATVAANGTQHRWPGILGILSFVQGKSQLYNLALEPAAGFDSAAYPQGNGYAALKLDPKGNAAVVGKLSDGTAFTSTGFVGPSAKLSMLVPLYSKLGYLSGTCTFSIGLDPGNPADNIVTGSFTWSRNNVSLTKPNEKIYRDGFLMDLDALGAAYTPPPTGYRVLELGNASSHVPISMELMEVFPLPSTSITRAVTISKTNACAVDNTPAPENNIKLVVVSSTGVFRGSFVKLAPKRTVNFSGLLLPRINTSPARGYGFFLMPGTTSTSPTLSGQVTWGP